jgi:5-methylphenazine-1-carboxylate 1-monooxygenase
MHLRRTTVNEGVLPRRLSWRNRKGGPESVIDVAEARAPDGFADVEAIASHDEREAILRGYAAAMAGFAREQVNRR